MTKKEANFELAENLYVYEHMTIDAIAQRLPVSERTLRYWKAEGNWDIKRYEYIRKRKAFHEELFDLAKKMSQSIKEEIKETGHANPSACLNLKRLIDLLDKVKHYENSIETENNSTENTMTTEELIELMKNGVLGL